MSAHHVKHASACPALGNGELDLCTCNAPGAAKAQEVTGRREPDRGADRVARVLAEKRRNETARRPPPAEPPDWQFHAPTIAHLQDTLTGLLGRHVSLVPATTTNGKIAVLQRCAACRSDISALVAPDESSVVTLGALGVEARNAYLRHRCEPVERSLFSLTYADLEALHADLERDGTRMVDRAAEIDRIKKARVS